MIGPPVPKEFVQIAKEDDDDVIGPSVPKEFAQTAQDAAHDDDDVIVLLYRKNSLKLLQS